MRLYYVTDEYIAYLRAYDLKVSHNKHEKRPYVGIVITIGNIEYYAPLSSPKEKHKHMKNGKDFRKIAGGMYGAINFNNMIPVVKEAVTLIDINGLEDMKYKRLLQNQYRAIAKDATMIQKTAAALRKLVLTKNDLLTPYEITVKQRCCDFALLESVCQNYTSE